MADEMRDLRAPNLVLAGHAIDVRTRTADVPALHDGGPPPHSRHMPRQQLSTRSDEPRCILAAGPRRWTIAATTVASGSARPPTSPIPPRGTRRCPGRARTT